MVDATRVAVDLHVHLGRDYRGHPVKIPAAPSLTLPALLDAMPLVGLGAVGVVEGHSVHVREELDELVRQGRIQELPDGYAFGGGLVLLGVEAELPVAGEYAHFLWFPETLDDLWRFQRDVVGHLVNPCLSTPHLPMHPEALAEWGGWVIPAHIFTPFKGVLARTGALAPSGVHTVELGLSADTAMAEPIRALAQTTFVTNSDAHSLKSLGREYNELPLCKSPRALLELVAKGGILRNVGIPPALGKYHANRCRAGHDIPAGERRCPTCGGLTVGGVSTLTAHLDRGPSPRKRPPYWARVPLPLIPGIGPKTLARLRMAIGSDRYVLEHALEANLAEVVGADRARRIVLAREGRLPVSTGGAGSYGRVGPGETP